MFLKIIFPCIAILFFSLGTFVMAQEDIIKTDVPWDSVAAELQIIDSLREPDSIKFSLTKKLFIKHHLTEQDYRVFYEDFLKQPVEKQREFMETVKAILQALMRQNTNSKPQPIQNK